LQIAFRQVQRARLPDLSREEFLYLFAVWQEHDRARREAKAAALHARLAQLWEEHALPPQQRAALTAPIAEVARAIAELNTPSLPAPSGNWG
jgi:hypothetical protein